MKYIISYNKRNHSKLMYLSQIQYCTAVNPVTIITHSRQRADKAVQFKLKNVRIAVKCMKYYIKWYNYTYTNIKIKQI